MSFYLNLILQGIGRVFLQGSTTLPSQCIQHSYLVWVVDEKWEVTYVIEDGPCLSGSHYEYFDRFVKTSSAQKLHLEIRVIIKFTEMSRVT